MLDRLFSIRPFAGTLVFVTLFAWAAWGWLPALFAAAAAWGIYWLVWVFRYGATKLSWEHAADELDVDLVRHDAGVFHPGDDPLASLLLVMTPDQPDFELTGTLDGRDVTVRVDLDASPTRTIWEVDTTDLLPDWLSVRPSSLEAFADRWLDLEDVIIGHAELDTRAVIAGPDEDTVREFFWDHDIADDLVRLFDDVGPFRILDGRVRITATGIARQSRPIRNNVERLRAIADCLEVALESDGGVEAEFDDVEQQSEATVHTYD